MTPPSIPKIELHCHLDGILDPGMVRDILQDNPTFPIRSEEFAGAYPVTDYQSFFAWFQFIRPIFGELNYCYPILGKHIERLKAQNVLYTELMIAASNFPHDPREAVEKMSAFRSWVNQQEAGVVQIEFLVAIGRQRSPEVVAELEGFILALHESGLIVGVSLGGPESGYPVKPFQRTFARFHEAGLGIDIHAGEWCGPESVWDALEYGFPDRIGHGVSLFDDPKLVEIFQERQIHIEMCPTSNVKTRSVARIEDHPIEKAKVLGLNFSVNTDDPGPFECSLESEYELLSSVFGFEITDFFKIYRNSLEARFQSHLRVNHDPEEVWPFHS